MDLSLGPGLSLGDRLLRLGHRGLALLGALVLRRRLGLGGAGVRALRGRAIAIAGCEHVGLDDPSARPRARERAELDPALVGHPTSHGRGLDPAVAVLADRLRAAALRGAAVRGVPLGAVLGSGHRRLVAGLLGLGLLLAFGGRLGAVARGL
ncbi:MAG: hypothetical protein AVDCRST_MAG45-1843 [uncultured Solirubrobacterales bacterium]|uniref:Uncharacterized protein n=1 Tax=uncultured Solirubrobacterales bacterium TaxID=768556 RepID=A0A6J4SZE6_9ACTN|nr:MAG: hypothetical protein AVDCRST_MAG45-1843 [uncultured Solirubrobacterales bacterium]